MNKICNGHCTGCAACYNICPNNAIIMAENPDGFYEPRIKEDLCIDCKKCEKVCPVNQPNYLNSKMPLCYATWADDETRAVSSSGGAFTVLAQTVLNSGGCICGVKYGNSFAPKHTIVYDSEHLAELRGSKYMQSYIGDIYSLTEKILREERPVLFTGLPCQIAGLNAYLNNREFRNLYTVELVCHGITSMKVFRKYRQDVLGNKNLTTLEFKKKTPWGWHAGINAEFGTESSYRVPAEDDPFFQAYLNNISKNEACGSCPFNRLPRQADITIGDFWGISNFDSSLNDQKGTSLILVNSDHGRLLLENARTGFTRQQEVPLPYAIAGNPSLKSPYKNHMRRKKFFRELEDIPFQKLVANCKQNKLSVGITGLWYGLNYGSILTYFALHKTLNQMGYDTLMVNKPNFIWSPLYDAPTTIAHKFISKHCTVSGIHKYEDYPLLNHHCDTFIVGSDVVWNYEICGREGRNYFYLDFADDTKRKISYASSFGGSYNAPEADRYLNQHYLQRFDAVSVREENAVSICQEKFGIHAQKVLDPVFLCNRKSFDDCTKEAGNLTEEPFIMTYILGGNELQKRIILHTSEMLGIKKLINIANPNNPERVANALQLDMTAQPSVEEWLWYMKHTNFFVGDSFHGLCFALIFRKPFLIAISQNMPSKDRFQTLLSLCGLEERLLFIEQDNSDKDYLYTKEIDFDEIDAKLEPYKQESLKWLKNALESRVSEKSNKYDEKIPDAVNPELFLLAKAVSENYHERTVITWGHNNEFNEILVKYFGIRIPFWVAKNLDLVNGTSVRAFSELKNRSKEYYLVIPEKEHTQQDESELKDYGYEDIQDFIYRHHKSITIPETVSWNNKYFDVYGNVINISKQGNTIITLTGWNNRIHIGEIITTSPLQITANGNLNLDIEDNCHFTGDIKIVSIAESKGAYGVSVRIKKNCVFLTDTSIYLFPNFNPYPETSLLINQNCTFGTNAKIDINSGNKVIIGEDCMFSHNINIQAGDGHAIFDVKTGKRINPFAAENNAAKTKIVFGRHIWVGKNSLLLNGTNIGEGSIVGAGSIVKSTVPNNCVIAGNPAKIIRTDAAWSRNNRSNKLTDKEKEYAQETRQCAPPISGNKVLVVGGTRFMGIELVKELLNSGNDVTIATRGNSPDNFNEQVQRLKLDVSDASTVKNALAGKYYDVVFDNLAYCSIYADNILSNVKCGKYVQLSSVIAYGVLNRDLREEMFNPCTIISTLCNTSVGYMEGKRQAEAIAYQKYSEIPSVTVRIPYVTKTDRLYYYVRNTMKQIPMKISDTSHGFTFIRSTEVGRFLPWIAAQDFTGAINLASEGMITIQMILDYILEKTGKKALIDPCNGLESPFHVFNEKTFSMNMEKAQNLGYKTSNLNNWFWKLMDEYITRAQKEFNM